MILLHGDPRSQTSFNNCLILNIPQGLVTHHETRVLSQGLIEWRLGNGFVLGQESVVLNEGCGIHAGGGGEGGEDTNSALSCSQLNHEDAWLHPGQPHLKTLNS